jgi:hypothetical protein
VTNLNTLAFQYKVTLLGIEPPVWRRIQVPAKYSFWDLHVAIQDATGWLDYHLHAFRNILYSWKNVADDADFANR